MDGKRIIGIDIGKRWLDVAREDAAEVEQHANEAATIAALVGTFDPARDMSCRALWRLRAGAGGGAGDGECAVGGGAFALGQGIPPGSGHQG